MDLQHPFGECQAHARSFAVQVELVEQPKYPFVVCRFYPNPTIPDEKHRF